MWPHPDRKDIDITAQFPELFQKHDLKYFDLPNGRMTDYLYASNYLDASRKAKDVGKIFSAVQRAMKQGEHKSLETYLKGSENAQKLANANNVSGVRKVLDEITEAYNDKYGMMRQIRGFYTQYLDDEGKKTLLGKIPRPASYRPGQYYDSDGSIRVRVDFLIEELRNPDAHAATYRPLPTQENAPLYIEREKGNPRSAWHLWLTFEEFYELTRRAMAQLWLEEYETYWNSGGKEIIERVVAEVQAQCDELNAAIKISGKA